MNFTAIITLFCAAAVLLIGFRVFLLDKDHWRNRTFFLFSILLAWMNICWYEIAQASQIETVQYYQHLLGLWPLAGPLLVGAMWLYCFKDPKLMSRFTLWAGVGILVVPALFFSYLEMFTTAVHGQVVPMPDDNWGLAVQSFNTIDLWRMIWCFVILVWASGLAFHAYRTERHQGKRPWKRMLFYVTAFSLLASFTQNFLLPLLGYSFLYNQSINTLFAILFFGWAFSDFRLFEFVSDKAVSQVAQHMTNLLFITDSSCRIKKINPAAQRFLGHEEWILDNIPLKEVLGEGICEECQHLMGTLQPVSKEITLVKDEAPAHLHLTISPNISKRGKVEGFTIVGTDLTAFRQVEEKVRHFAHELQESNDMLEKFAYIASHDLKEPLRTVNSFVTLLSRRLEQHQLDAKTQEYFHFIADGAQRMHTIVESILEVSKLGQESGKRRKVDINKVVQKILTRILAGSERKNPIFLIDPLPEVVFNPQQIEMLFAHLIDNALKYNENPNPTVEIGCKTKGSFHYFSVKDNGIGIDPQFHERIFQLFKRLHSRAEYSGAGVGLSLCQKVVELAGGKIWIESSPGEGSIFFFTLPIHKLPLNGRDRKSKMLKKQPLAVID